jgi:hypothetical protein
MGEGGGFGLREASLDRDLVLVLTRERREVGFGSRGTLRDSPDEGWEGSALVETEVSGTSIAG